MEGLDAAFSPGEAAKRRFHSRNPTHYLAHKPTLPAVPGPTGTNYFFKATYNTPEMA
jgi:hypothetical protein